MEIELKNITQKYGEFTAVNDLSLSIQTGEMLALLGPSGYGKTTLLRTIAGLIPLYKGAVYLDGVNISGWPAQKRNTAMVFQSYALFPNMTVAENILYGLKVRKINKEIQKHKLKEILARVMLEGYGNRKIYELSGGQQQRVALARALVIEPDVLLFDEPLSNLDEKLRVSMRQEIRKLQQEYGITSVYVTHDQEEAMSIADRIVIMKDGIIQQVGTPVEVYFNPLNIFTADFMGLANILEPDALEAANGHVTVKVFNNTYKLKSNGLITEKTKIMLRPENILISETGQCRGIIKWHENLGAFSRITIEVQGSSLTVQTLNSCYRDYKRGDLVNFSINPEALHLIQ